MRRPRRIVPALVTVMLVMAAAPRTFAADLTVKSLHLAFDDGGEVKVTSRGQTFTAVAEIVYEGSGTLRALWEIAEPAGRGRTAKLRSFAEVEEELPAGAGSASIESPRLPSSVLGTYAVRFSTRAPSAPRKDMVRYFVGETPSEEVLGGRREVPDAIATRSPSGPVGRETTFSWDPVPGSIGYQVEIYDEKEGEGVVVAPEGTFGVCLVRHPSELNRPPLVGLMAPGYQTKATVTELAGTLLTRGKTYLWRVVALGQRGKVLCESPFRKFTYGER